MCGGFKEDLAKGDIKLICGRHLRGGGDCEGDGMGCWRLLSTWRHSVAGEESASRRCTVPYGSPSPVRSGQQEKEG